MKIKNITIFLLVLLLMKSFQAQISTNEKIRQFQSLKWLYESIQNQDKTEKLTNWNFINNPNYTIDTTWKGIRIDHEGYVTHLDISNLDLIAEFEKDPTFNRLCLIYLPKLNELNLSNNQFSGYFPILEYAENPFDPQGVVHTLSELEIINISNNRFIWHLAIPQSIPLLKELKASGNQFISFDVNYSLQLCTLDLRDNSISLGNAVVPRKIQDSLYLQEWDISENNLTFENLWRASSSDSEYRNFFHEENTQFTYMPQKPVSLHWVVVNNQVRALPGDSRIVNLPNIGQNTTHLPEIKDSLHYDWYKNNRLITDTTPYLKRDSIQSSDYGTYYCKISYTGERLKDFWLQTESFQIDSIENQPPKLFIHDNNLAFQRIIKGGISKEVTFTATDDIPIDHPLAINGNTFKIIQYPKKLEFTGNLSTIQVKDTSSFFIGFDTLTVEYCDFEGGCTTFDLIYEIYDNLYVTSIDSIKTTQDNKMEVFLNADFYNENTVKPDGYICIFSKAPNVTGAGGLSVIETVKATGTDTKKITCTIPKMNQEFMLAIELKAFQNDTLFSVDKQYVYLAMPMVSDSITGYSYNDSLQIITLNWELKSSPLSFNFTNNNSLYYSEDGISFELLARPLATEKSFMHPISTDKKEVYYKLVKRALSYDITPYDVELPYLSHTMKVTLKEDNSILDCSKIKHNTGKNIKIYPNPVTNILTIEKQNLQVNTVKIFDNNGKNIKLFNKLNTHKNTITLDVSDIPCGIYNIEIKGTQGCVFIGKIVKE